MHVQGRYTVHPRYGSQIAIRSLRAARADEVDYAALLDGPPRGAAQMEADLRDLVGTVQSPHLRALLEAVLGPRRRRPGAASATLPPPSATTRPTATGCSSTR